ncbi:uncharacterized protein FPRN_03364 [Fusarium proliferatum]|nr:uncharacterized protein FPRN_03364 [Fusarium proliferatum]
MCCGMGSKNQIARDDNAWRYRHTNYIFNNAGGQYIKRMGKYALIAGKGPLWEWRPMREHTIPHKNRPKYDHTAPPIFNKINWDGGGNGADQLRRTSPRSSVRSEYHSPKPVFKKVDWNAKGHPVRSVSPRGTTFRLSARRPRDAPMMDAHKPDNIEEGLGP